MNRIYSPPIVFTIHTDHYPTSVSPELSKMENIANPITSTTVSSNFEYLPKHDQMMVKDAYDVISRKELWRPFREALLSRGVDSISGFTYSNDPVYQKIMTEINSTYIGGLHSGSSMGHVMRQMEYIALYGEDKYRINMLSKLNNQ